jgi:excisionase family DNA binding protein
MTAGAAAVGVPSLLTIPEACRRLSISRATFYRLIERGHLRTVAASPSGRSRRIPSTDIELYIERLRREAGGGA